MIGVAATPARAQTASGAQSARPAYFIMLEGTRAIGDSSKNDITYTEFSTGSSATGISTDAGDGWQGRIGIGANLTNQIDVQLLYTGLRSSKSNQTANSTGGGGFPYYAVLGTLPTSWNQAVVKTRVKAHIIDLNAGYNIGLGGGGNARLSAGLRYGRFKQTTDAQFLDIVGGSSAQFTDSRNSTFNGGGPTLGASGDVPIGGGFGLTGSLLGGLLYGTQSTVTKSNFTGGSFTGTAGFQNDHAAYTFEGQAGVTYAINLGGASAQVALGYQVSYFANVRDTRNSVSAFGNTYGSPEDDLLFHGPFARLKIGFN
jgi:hypothetical protein